MRLLYQVFVRIYLTAFRFSTLYSARSRAWFGGRRNLLKNMKKAAGSGKPLVWFHCASLGEFEQGRSVMEQFREKFPEYEILLTFFSPSGYEIRKAYQGADYVCYLPADTLSNAKKFIRIWKPKLAIFIKYEYWYNFMHVLHRHRIPLAFVSARFRDNHYFFRPRGYWFRKQIRHVAHFFVQDASSKELLHSIGVGSVTVSGDTRFDRVMDIRHKAPEVWQMEAFSKNDLVMIAGSTWEPDEQLIAAALGQIPDAPKLIIAPHLIEESGIQRIMQLFGGHCIRFSRLKGPVPPEIRVVIIDGIGLLSGLYRYARIAYIGGGFGRGIHNTLEAATFGLPVVFGPNHLRFNEAVDLIARGGAFPVNNAGEAADIFKRLFRDESFRKNAGKQCSRYVEEKSGATAMVIAGLSNLLK